MWTSDLSPSTRKWTRLGEQWTSIRRKGGKHDLRMNNSNETQHDACDNSSFSEWILINTKRRRCRRPARVMMKRGGRINCFLIVYSQEYRHCFLLPYFLFFRMDFFEIVGETASDVRLDGDEGAGRVRVQSLELSLIQAC